MPSKLYSTSKVEKGDRYFGHNRRRTTSQYRKVDKSFNVDLSIIRL